MYPAGTTRRGSRSFLRATNDLARAYHGGLEPTVRTTVEESFRFGEIDVVVATKAFGLGVDKPDIALIVHLEMPASVEEYVQETGRAARGARMGEGPEAGTCVLLRMPRDCGIHRQFVKGAAPDLDLVRRVWDVVHGGERYLVVELLAERLGLGREDADAMGLALHHLQHCGAIERLPDVMWEGVVRVPGDVELLLADLDRHDPDRASELRRFVKRIDELGTAAVRRVGLVSQARHDAGVGRGAASRSAPSRSRRRVLRKYACTSNPSTVRHWIGRRSCGAAMHGDSLRSCIPLRASLCATTPRAAGPRMLVISTFTAFPINATAAMYAVPTFRILGGHLDHRGADGEGAPARKNLSRLLQDVESWRFADTLAFALAGVKGRYETKQVLAIIRASAASLRSALTGFKPCSTASVAKDSPRSSDGRAGRH